MGRYTMYLILSVIGLGLLLTKFYFKNKLTSEGLSENIIYIDIYNSSGEFCERVIESKKLLSHSSSSATFIYNNEIITLLNTNLEISSNGEILEELKIKNF